jgi:hypothetical protein
MSATRPVQGASEFAAQLATWLAGGEIQAPSGAFCAWRERDGELAFEYPEITGYALTWLAARPNLSSAELDAGTRAASWLLKRLDSRDVSAHADWDQGAVYTFDLGMISAGLISFGRRTREPRFVDRGMNLASDLARLFLDQESPLQIDPRGPATGREPTWSNAGHPHLAKCVQALLLADQSQAAETLIAHAIGYQDSSGYFQTQPQEDLVMLHPHFYAVEALWMWGTARGDEEALSRARHATEWAWGFQLAEGGLPRLVDFRNHRGPAIEQLDITSQAIRATLLLDAKADGLQRAVDRLLLASHAAGRGAALPYQPQSTSTHLNAWVTMFGAQALELVGRREGERALGWQELV